MLVLVANIHYVFGYNYEVADLVWHTLIPDKLLTDCGVATSDNMTPHYVLNELCSLVAIFLVVTNDKITKSIYIAY